MMRYGLAVLFTLMAAAPAVATEPPPEASAPATGPAVDCINLSGVVSRRPLGRDMLLFEMLGGGAYRNKLAEDCPGLERAAHSEAIAFETTGSRLCRNDTIRVFDPSSALGPNASPRCRIGRFTPIKRPTRDLQPAK